MADPDPLDAYLRSNSPYTKPGESQTSDQASAPIDWSVRRFSRDLGVAAGQVPVGAVQMMALPLQAGAAAIGHSDWMPSNESIGNALTMGPTASTPEEERYGALGRGIGSGLPLLATPVTRPYAVPVMAGGGAGGYASKWAEQAFPDFPLAGPIAGLGIGAVAGAAPGLGPLIRNPSAVLNAARRIPQAVELGWLRSIAIEHGAQRAGEVLGNLLGSPAVGSFVGGLIHWGPVIGPALHNFARNAVGAVPGALSGLRTSIADSDTTPLNPFTAP